MTGRDLARSPFVQVALPVIAVVIVGFTWSDARIDRVHADVDRVHADIDKLDRRLAKVEESVSDIPDIKSKLGIMQADIEGVKTDVAGLTRKVDTIENRLLTTLENAVRELRQSRRPAQYGFSGDTPYTNAQVMDVLRGKEVRLPVAALVPEAGGVWAGLHVGVKISGNRFTVYPDTGNEKLVEVFTNNHWTPVDSADLSKGLVETVR